MLNIMIKANELEKTVEYYNIIKDLNLQELNKLKYMILGYQLGRDAIDKKNR